MVNIAWVNAEECVGCEACVDECPHDAMHMNDEGVAVSDPVKCKGEEACGDCAPVCGVEAITFKPQ